jgi:geranylgeranyl transferase type-1 subunit beta
MLGSLESSGRQENIDWLLHNQNPIMGGFGKHDNEFPDPLHTFMGIAGLALINYENLNKLFPALTISHQTLEHLRKIQASWKNE